MSISSIPKTFVYTGSNPPQSPFEGQIWYDTTSQASKQYQNGKWVSIQADLSPVWDAVLDQEVSIAELFFMHSSNAGSREELFVDPFVDGSKISSKSVALTTGANGYIGLNTLLEGFDDGDVSEWSGSTGNLTVQTSYSITGNTLEYNSGGGDSQVSRTFTSTSNSVSFKAMVDNESGSTGDRAQITLTDGSGNRVAGINFEDQDNFLTASGTDIGLDWNTNQLYEIKIVPDFSANTYDIYIDGTLQYSGASFITSASSFGGIILDNDSNNSNINRNIYFDDLVTSVGSSGTLTSVTIDKGYTPSGVYFDADYSSGSSTAVEATVYDGNGNQVVFTESEFGTQKTASFTGQTIQVDLSLSTSDTSKNPTVNDYGVRLVK